MSVSINYYVNLWMFLRFDYETFISGTWYIGPMWVIADIVSSIIMLEQVTSEFDTMEWFSFSLLVIVSEFAVKTFIAVAIVISAISLTYIAWIIMSARNQLSSKDSSVDCMSLFPVWIEANIIGTHMMHFQCSIPVNTWNVLSWSISGTTFSFLTPEAIFTVKIWVLPCLMRIEAGSFTFSAWFFSTAWPWDTSELGNGSFRWWINVVVILVFFF